MKTFLDKNNWKKFSLKEVCHKTEFKETDPEKKGIFRFLKVEHMDAENLHITNCADMREEDLPPTFYKRFEPGQMLFPTRNPHLRRAVQADFEGICGEKTLTLSPNEDVIDKRFFPFIFHSDFFVNHCVSAIVGSTNPHVRWRDVSKFEFLLPSLNEQQRLADLLWAGDQLVQRYIKEFNYILIYKNKYFRENYQLGNSNKKIKLSSLFELNPSKVKLSNNQMVSFVSMEDITEDGKIENKTDRKYEEVSTGYKSFTDGDILFAKITPCMENGKGAIASDLTNGYGFGSTEFHILRPINDFDRSYIYHLSQAPFFRLLAKRQMTGSAGQKRVPVDFLLNFKLNLPALEKRIEIGNKMNNFDQMLELINKNIAVTKLINDSIKNEIFS